MSSNDNPLNDLFWRDEILQIMYWFRGESLGETVTPDELRRFLTDDAPVLAPHLQRMVSDGLLVQAEPGRYRLTDLGHSEGGRRFRDAFEGLTKPAHGECSADCDCHTGGDPEACESRRHAHAH